MLTVTVGYTLVTVSDYRIAGNFRGVLIFVNFVVHPGVTKFSAHENFPQCQIWTGDVLLWLFFATCNVLGPQSPLSQAVPSVTAEEVNRAV